jgi:hypothetical protein
MAHMITRRVVAGLAAAFLGASAWPASASVRPVFSLSPPGLSERSAPIGFSLAPPQEKESERQSGSAAPDLVMPKKWRRALVQLGIVSVYSTYRYWRDYHEWIEDWQYELTFADQYRRFLTTEAIRFDSNSFPTNWSHIPGGGLYYLLARSNYLDWEESLLATFVSSAIYEYVSEWREVISINDMFLTTFGGYSLGETWFQLSDYFHHQRSAVLKAFGFMNPINKLNQWLDRRNPASHVYAQPGWASLVLSAGWWRSSETGRTPSSSGLVSLETQLIRTPEYGRPGTFRKVLHDTTLSELSLGARLRRPGSGEEDLRGGPSEEVDIFARVVGLSWFRQTIDELGRGSSLSIGLGSALTYLRKRPPLYDARAAQVRIDPVPERPTDFRDKLAVTHLLGPVVDWTRFGRNLRIRAVADAYFDFALVNAYAFNAYSALYPIDDLKTTLAYYGYHYAYGASSSVRVDVDWGNLWVRGLASGHVWDSWEGRDRFQDEILNDAGAVDTRTRFLLQAGWRLGSAPLRAFAGIEGIHRWGRVGEVRASGGETRTFAGLSYLF